MATSVSKTVTYEGMDYSGSVTTTISGNTVTVKYSVTAPSNWMKVKVWLNGTEYWLVSSVPWSGTKTLTKTLTISGPSTIGCAMGIIHPDTGANVKTIIHNTNLSQTPASYKVAYNANGGTGAPSSQTKYYGTAIKLSATKPTRTGYTFAKWTTAANGTGTPYAPGDSYTANAAATLYAQWTANKYTVTYDANGGTGAPAAQTKTYGQSMIITSTEPTRARYRFLGWAESKTAASAQYSAGGTYSKAITSNVTLYAVWELAYQPPVVSKVTAVRCDADGNDADDGTYARVSAVWSVDTVYDASNVGTVVGGYAAQGSEESTEFSMAPNGTASGTATAIVPNMSADVQYLITATASDAVEIGGIRYTGERSTVLTKAAFVLDFHSGGRGIGIGCAAPDEGLSVGYETEFLCQDIKRFYSGGQVREFLKRADFDSRRGVVPSATQYLASEYMRDCNDESAAYDQVYLNTSGNLWRSIGVGRSDSDGANRVTNSVNLGIDKDGNRLISVSDAEKWLSAIGAAAESHNHSAADITSGTLPISRGGTGQTSKLAAYKALGGWTKVAGITGTNSATIDLSGYYEVMIVGWYSTTYIGSANFMVANFGTTQKEVYLGGGYYSSGARRCAVKLSTTKITGVCMNIDSSSVTGNWNLYAR